MITRNLFLVTLCLVSFVLFGCKKKSSSDSANKTNTTTTVNPNTPSPTDNKPTGTPIEPVTTIPSTGTTPVDPPASGPVASISSLCGDVNFDIKKEVLKAANSLKGIMYNRNPDAKADCSGIYHRVLKKFKTPCPNAKVPSFDNARDSRSLAAWYKKNGNFKIIRNPAKNADLIQPGAVMFYGYTKRRNHYDFQKMNMDTLTLRGTGINHISIVTSVNRKDGELISYEMFHGRTDNKPSAITKSYKVTSWDKTWPMYGNAFEPWLAIAQPFGSK